MMAFTKLSVILSIVISISPAGHAGTACLDDTRASLEKGERARAQGQDQQALQEYSLAAQFACSTEERSRAQFGRAQSFYRLNEQDSAESALAEIFEDDSPKLFRKGSLLRAWYQPETRARLSLIDRRAFDKFEENALRIRERTRMKVPWLAGFSSAILPGLGQAYNGEYQAGGLSFLLNAVLLATALELNRRGLRDPALTAGLLFTVTYVGGIFSAVESARAINRQKARPHLEEERRQTLPFVEL